MKRKSKKDLWISLVVYIIGIVILSIYLLKPWIPLKYRNSTYCDESIKCGYYGNIWGGYDCVNKYYGSDEWLVLGGPTCYCNVSENKCVVVPYSPPQYKKPEISYSCYSDADCYLVDTDKCNIGNFHDEVCINSSSVNMWNSHLNDYKRRNSNEFGKINCPEMQLNSNFSCTCIKNSCITHYVSFSYNVTINYTLKDINQSYYNLLKEFTIK